MKKISTALLIVMGLSFVVTGFAEEFTCPKAELPLKLYGDCTDEFTPPYIPSGWMGNTMGIMRDDCWEDNPHSGTTCIKLSYEETGGWAGIVWQNPADDWGDMPGGFDLSGAKKLTFWVRGDKGGEMVEFKFGLLGRNKPYHDSARGSSGRQRLSTAWEKVEIPCDGKDMSCIKTGFAWTVAGRKEPVVFYIDDIRYE